MCTIPYWRKTLIIEVESSDHDWKDGSATGWRYVLGQEDKGSSGNIEDRMVLLARPELDTGTCCCVVARH